MIDVPRAVLRKRIQLRADLPWRSRLVLAAFNEPLAEHHGFGAIRGEGIKRQVKARGIKEPRSSQ
jgi:hypothetical protein